MEAKEILKRYFARLRGEGLFKAALWSLLIGFSAMILSSAFWWFFGLKNFWLCIIIFLGVTVVSTTLFYFLKYRPTILRTAKRIDALGLEERLITMTEYERESTLMALKQREDSISALKKFDTKLIKIAVSVSMLITLGVVCICGVGANTVAALTENGVLKSGMQLIEELNAPKPVEYIVEYVGGENGSIKGETYQVIKEGGNASPVMAVANEGWVFAGWSDLKGSPYREDSKIYRTMRITAIFEKIEKPDDDDEISDNDYGNLPNFDDPPAPPETSSDFRKSNSVFNGSTYYGGPIYDGALKDAVEEIGQDQNLNEGEKDLIEDYFKVIER